MRAMLVALVALAGCASQYPGTFSERYQCHKQAYDQSHDPGAMAAGILIGGAVGGAIAGSATHDSPSGQSEDDIYHACMAALHPNTD